MMIEIGQVIETPSDDYKELAGIKLLILASERAERVVIGPVSKEDFERYYKVSFETMGRKWISENYKDFLEYVLSECELIPYVKLSDLKDVRKATAEDVEVYNNSRECFIKKYNLEISE